MSEKPPSKDEALEALDFIVNVLKEHEKDLDRLVSELGTVADQMGENGEVNVKVKKIEDKITSLQVDIGNMMKSVSLPRQEPSPLQQAPTAAYAAPVAQVEANINLPNAVPLQLQCNQWEDFQHLATGAQAAAFTYKLSLIHISEPTRLGMISYAVFCLKKKKSTEQNG
eukprot:TRINITY_DN12356_c0_g1_i1.p1 TRINITY_DN12356_c0_g1~~TRINITY_DN12356_c0_g1_i1.p1  ORF type:complete len:169 (-),score=9.33 TRINITY_DN12356_c0_g1_i1:62-568(-)